VRGNLKIFLKTFFEKKGFQTFQKTFMFCTECLPILKSFEKGVWGKTFAKVFPQIK